MSFTKTGLAITVEITEIKERKEGAVSCYSTALSTIDTKIKINRFLPCEIDIGELITFLRTTDFKV